MPALAADLSGTLPERFRFPHASQYADALDRLLAFGDLLDVETLADADQGAFFDARNDGFLQLANASNSLTLYKLTELGRRFIGAHGTVGKVPSAPRPPHPADLVATYWGSLYLLRAQTPAGVEWIDEHLPPRDSLDVTTWGDAIAVEPRYIAPIVDGAEHDGLTVLRQ